MCDCDLADELDLVDDIETVWGGVPWGVWFDDSPEPELEDA